MDAKAKVVAWQWRPVGVAIWITDGDEPTALHNHEMYETRALIPLTDHEAALAEVEERRDHWHDYSVRRVEQIDKLTVRLTTLLTGLEALAGEWERDAELLGFDKEERGYAKAQCALAKHLRRTLTNSAKEST